MRHHFQPESSPPVERLVKKLETWKALVAIAAALIAAGFLFQQCKAELASAADVQSLRGVAADRASAVEAEVAALKTRTAVVEALSRQTLAELRDIHAQLVDVARATGARITPAQGAQP